MPRSPIVRELRALLSSQDGISSAESLELPALRGHDAIQGLMPASGVRRFETGLSEALYRSIGLLNDEYIEAALLWHFGIAEGSGLSTPQLRRARAIELSSWGSDAYGKDRWNRRTGDWDKCRLTRALERIEIYLNEMAEPSTPAVAHAALDGGPHPLGVPGPRRYDSVADYSRGLIEEVGASTTLSYLGPSPLDGLRVVLAGHMPYRWLRLLWMSAGDSPTELLHFSLELTELGLPIPVIVARGPRGPAFTVHVFESALFVALPADSPFEALRFAAGTRQYSRFVDFVDAVAIDSRQVTILPTDDYAAIGRKLTELVGEAEADTER